MLSTKLRRITQLLLPLLLSLASSVALADPSANTGNGRVGDLASLFSPPTVLKILDNTTRKPVKNTPVRIYSDNGMVCFSATCATNGVDWEGSTDTHGVLRIPSQVVQNSTHIFVTGYSAADFKREAKAEANGGWTIALDARDLGIESVSVRPKMAKIRCYEEKELVKLGSNGLPIISLPKKPSDDWCGRSLCGCSTAVKLKCVTKIVSATPTFSGQQPLYPSNLFPERNVKISCGEKYLAVSDSEGDVAFTLNTSTSPGCSMRCGTLTFSKELPASYETWEVDVDFGGWTVLGQDYQQKGERTNSKNNGSWKEWCSRRQWGNIDQQLRVSGQFKDGQKDGEWTEWHCTGGMKSQGLYKDGKKEGVWKEWYENGQIHYQAEWHVDKLHGKQFFWYSEGRLESESEFRDGEYFGVRKYFPKEGEAYYLDHRGFVIKAE